MLGGTSLVLVIEDDDLVGNSVSRTLKRDNYRVKQINNGVDGLNVAREYKPNLIILDAVMQGTDGITVCEEIRADPIIKETPILFITAKINVDDCIKGLRAGADDCLPKPFNFDELSFRVEALLRSTNIVGGIVEGYDDSTNPIPIGGSFPRAPKEIHLIEVGEYQLDFRSYELNTPGNGKVLLTPIQYQLVYFLITHVDMVFSPYKLLEEVWNFPSYTGSTELVRVHIQNLRKRIEIDPANPRFIQTVPGYGYTIKSLD
jgi:DNA-binding response OmpR family regulator